MLQIPKWLHSSEDSEVDNHLEKKVEFADLVKDAGSVAIAGSAPSRQFRAGRNDVTNTVWLPRQFQNDGLPANSILQDEFLQDSAHSRGWNFGVWKNWMFTCYRRRQKSKLSEVTFDID